MLYLGRLLLLIVGMFPQGSPDIDRTKIELINTGTFIPYAITDIQGGSVVGNMLNAHYFPGLTFYNGGRYKEAEEQFTYVITRSSYLDQNPRREEYLSTAYYLRGMIYQYHAKGLGRQILAKADFESALTWNARNHTVYIELSRLYAGLGFRDQAVTILRHLLDLSPDQKIAGDARNELDTLGEGGSKK